MINDTKVNKRKGKFLVVFPGKNSYGIGTCHGTIFSMNLKQTINNLPFRTKMVLSCFIISLISFLIFAFASGGIVTRQLRRSTAAQTEQTIVQVGNSLDVYLLTMEKLIDYVALLTSGDDVSLGLAFEKLREANPEITGMLYARENDSFVCNGLYRVSRDLFSQEDWYEKAVQAQGKLVLLRSNTGRNITTEDVFSVDDVFSLVKAVIDPLNGEVQGVILFDVRHDIIRNSINNVSIGKNGFVFVLDQQREIVYAPVNPIVFRLNPLWLESGDTYVMVKIGGKSYSLQTKESLVSGWLVVGVFPTNEVLRDINTTLYVMAFSFLVALFCIAIFSYLLSNSITKPLSKLQNLMEQAEAGNLSVRFNTKYTDEVGALGHSFNHMLEQIEQLIQQVYEEQQDKRNAELRILQEQIKPHFLYNTLDTISWLSRENGADDVVLLVDALTNMFRVGLSNGKEYISVKEEIRHVSSYLYIQQIRYNTKLAYEITVPEELERYTVPKLILQPLVENAIYHGIKQKREKGIVSVAVSKQDNILVFTVRDTGSGIGKKKLLELQTLLAEKNKTLKTSFGLFYVNERVKLSCGATYGVFIDSEEGKWTTSTVFLPAMVSGELKDG